MGLQHSCGSMIPCFRMSKTSLTSAANWAAQPENIFLMNVVPRCFGQPLPFPYINASTQELIMSCNQISTLWIDRE